MAVRERIIAMSSSEMGLWDKSVIERMPHMGFNKATTKEEYVSSCSQGEEEVCKNHEWTHSWLQ